MLLDYHLHLWPHHTAAVDQTVENLAAFCSEAAAAGVVEIALTEHLFRFRQADALLQGWWNDDPDAAMRATMARYWDEHVDADLDAYVDVVLAARRAGLPVVLGLEVDHYRGRMDRVARLLSGYPFDVLLGSVHWIGAWGFDLLEVPVALAEWELRDVEVVWDAYTRDLEELAASGTVDVLAHPDLVKVAGHRPAVPDEFHDRMAEAAARAGLAAEVSSAGAGYTSAAGLRRPCSPASRPRVSRSRPPPTPTDWARSPTGPGTSRPCSTGPATARSPPSRPAGPTPSPSATSCPDRGGSRCPSGGGEGHGGWAVNRLWGGAAAGAGVTTRDFPDARLACGWSSAIIEGISCREGGSA
jgi:histidinol-phosphatase (PHP family)